MKKVLFIVLLVCGFTSNICAQAKVKKPTIMVVPSDNWCVQNGFVQVFNNNKWEYQNKKQIIRDINDNIYEILNENYEQEHENILPNVQNTFTNFKKMYENKETKEKIDESAELVILNNS